MTEHYDTRVSMSVDDACEWLREMRNNCADATNGSQVFTAVDMAIKALCAQQQQEAEKNEPLTLEKKCAIAGGCRYYSHYQPDGNCILKGYAPFDCGKCREFKFRDDALTVIMGWISVEDRLPEKDGSYLVYLSKGKAVCTAHFWTKDLSWSGRRLNPYITHWQPLPAPPKGE